MLNLKVIDDVEKMLIGLILVKKELWSYCVDYVLFKEGVFG